MTRPPAFALLALLAACAKTPAGSTADAAPSAAATTECPKDLLAARGTPCAPDGKTCGTGAAGFTHFVMCSRGTWTEMEAPPPPPPPPPR
jgi:hypothetical protein